MLTELGLLGKIRPAFKQSNSSLAQLVERRTVNPQVAGSSPAGGAKFRKAASLDAAFLRFNFLICSSLDVDQKSHG